LAEAFGNDLDLVGMGNQRSHYVDVESRLNFKITIYCVPFFLYSSKTLSIFSVVRFS
jgi:hypothetical protein